MKTAANVYQNGPKETPNYIGTFSRYYTDPGIVEHWKALKRERVLTLFIIGQIKPALIYCYEDHS